METSMEDVMPYTSRTIHTNSSLRTIGRQQFSLGASGASIEVAESEDGLEELIYKTWNIFGVSPLFNFHQDELHLKQYAKRLREEAANNLKQENVTYSAEFSVMENIVLRPSPLDPPPIKVNLYTQKNGDEESARYSIYNGILLSWRSTKNELKSINSIRLPLLLCRGTRSAMGVVHNVLGRMFDCLITALSAQEDDLMWLITIILTPTSKEEYSRTKDEISMHYKIPELPDTDTITVKFPIVDLIKILKIILKDQKDEVNEISFNLEHIQQFRDVLYSQMLEVAHLQLGLCTLFRIHLPAFAISGNKMKAMNTDAMNRALLYLNEKALDIFHTFNFETC